MVCKLFYVELNAGIKHGYGSTFTTSIGRPKHVRVMAGGLEGDMFIGPKAEEHRGLLNIRYPIEVGH